MISTVSNIVCFLRSYDAIDRHKYTYIQYTFQTPISRGLIKMEKQRLYTLLREVDICSLLIIKCVDVKAP